MIKKLTAFALAAVIFPANSMHALLQSKKLTTVAQSAVVQKVAQVAQNNPTSAALVGTGLVAAALTQATAASTQLGYGSRAATAALAGAVIGESTKKVADNLFAAYAASFFAKGSHAEVLSKKIWSTVIAYGLNEVITRATAQLIAGKAAPGSKLSGTFGNWFTGGMALGYLKGDTLMLKGALPINK